MRTYTAILQPAAAHAGNSKWRSHDANTTACPLASPPTPPLTPHVATDNTPPPPSLFHAIHLSHQPEPAHNVVPIPLCRLWPVRPHRASRTIDGQAVFLLVRFLPLVRLPPASLRPVRQTSADVDQPFSLERS